MTPTICGHERDALIWALRYWAWDARRAELLLQYPDGGDTLLVSAARDANDPAKLAELLAEALREHGVNADSFRYGTEHAHGSVFVRIWHGFANGMIQVSLGEALRSHARMLTLFQARTALLRILELPQDTTADDAVKVLTDAS